MNCTLEYAANVLSTVRIEEMNDEAFEYKILKPATLSGWAAPGW
jgi:hypothetical protein